ASSGTPTTTANSLIPSLFGSSPEHGNRSSDVPERKTQMSQPEENARRVSRAVEGRHDGRRALVTGAGSGIGRATAQRLALEGACVACLDINEAPADVTSRGIRDWGGRALCVVADVRDRNQLQRAVDRAVEVFSGLDYLVNAAGVVTMHGFDDLTEDE